MNLELYYGKLRKGIPYGDGILLYPNGFRKYTGDFSCGKFNGYGKFFDENENLMYEGYFKNGKYHGIGISYYDNSTIKYSGNWRNGMYYGKGIFFNKNFQKEYEGEYKNNLRHGDGKFYSKSGKLFYEGSWVNDKKNGYGIQFHSNGVPMYKGQWKNNYWQGTGNFYTFQGHKIYEGNFRLSLRSGYGTYFRSSQEIQYIGQWKNDAPNGNGISFFPNQQIKYEGKWKNGTRHGTGIEYNKEGQKILEGKWENDIYISSNKNRNKIRNDFLLQQFLETNDLSLLKKIKPQTIRSHLEKKNIDIDLKGKRKEILIKILKNIPLKKEEEPDDNEELNIDLFGNEIQNPVKGTDGEIYDKSSMDYLFKRDKEGLYKNIPYIYNSFGVSVPNFPLMGNGKQLTGYSIL